MHGFYVQQSLLLVGQHADLGAPGAAITLALCGSWQHPPPCPLAAHHTEAVPDGKRLRLRTVFAALPDDEQEVRRRIDQALSKGTLAGPDGTRPTWTLLSTSPAEITAAEREHARRIAGT